MFSIEKWNDIKYIRSLKWKLPLFICGAQALALTGYWLSTTGPSVVQWITHVGIAIICSWISVKNLNLAIENQKKRLINILSD